MSARKEKKRMKRNNPYGQDQKWVVLLLPIASALFVLLLLSVRLGQGQGQGQGRYSSEMSFVEPPDLGLGVPKLPRFGYLISGSKGEGSRVRRLLEAVYHPRNYYVLHLDLEASDEERLDLAKYVKSKDIRNVMVVGKPNLVTSKGPTMIASTLRAVAILLNRAHDWDWFINLSASDYPLISQDGNTLSIVSQFHFFLFFL